MAKSQKASEENRSSYLEITDCFVSNVFKTFQNTSKILALSSELNISMYLQRYICWQMQLIPLHTHEYSQVS